MIEVKLLNSERVALVDEISYPFALTKHWKLSPEGYAWTWDGGMRRYIMMHRFLWEKLNGEIPNKRLIHHKDENKLNNQLDNLVIVTGSFNQAARSRINNSNFLFRGVSKKQGGNFQAHIRHNYILIYIGTFPDAKKAALAYDEKARQLFGPSAFQNFPLL